MDLELTKRAILAYFKTLPAGELREIPSASFERLRARKYIKLQISDKVVAVYRIENDGALKRLKRYPVEIGGTTRRI